MVSAPTEEDFKLDRFQDDQAIKSDNSCLTMDSEIEVQELVSPELSSSEDVVILDGEIFFPQLRAIQWDKNSHSRTFGAGRL
jgi:hypothetical protein